jgi:hypothetical protein
VSLSDISSAFAELSQCKGQVSYVFLTRAPLTPKGPFDLHVLGTPPAFILSQDQTLHEFVCRFHCSRSYSPTGLVCLTLLLLRCINAQFVAARCSTRLPNLAAVCQPRTHRHLFKTR